VNKSKQDQNVSNCHVIVDLSRAEVKRYQNTISDTSGHGSSMPMVVFECMVIISHYCFIVTLGLGGLVIVKL